MLGLGSTPSGFSNSALTGQAQTTVTGFEINQTYEWTFWYAPGYVINTSSGSKQYLFGSEPGAATTAQIEASILGFDTLFVSSVPTAQQAPTPLSVDWQQASLTFVAPSTELTFSLAVVPDGSTNPGALVGYYFFDDLALEVASKFILGDVNCDGEVNLLDVAPFIDAISTGTYIEKADINQDGFLDLLDVTPFVSLLSGN